MVNSNNKFHFWQFTIQRKQFLRLLLHQRNRKMIIFSMDVWDALRAVRASDPEYFEDFRVSQFSVFYDDVEYYAVAMSAWDKRIYTISPDLKTIKRVDLMKPIKHIASLDVDWHPRMIDRSNADQIPKQTIGWFVYDKVSGTGRLIYTKEIIMSAIN